MADKQFYKKYTDEKEKNSFIRGDFLFITVNKDDPKQTHFLIPNTNQYKYKYQ